MKRMKKKRKAVHPEQYIDKELIVLDTAEKLFGKDAVKHVTETSGCVKLLITNVMNAVDKFEKGESLLTTWEDGDTYLKRAPRHLIANSIKMFSILKWNSSGKIVYRFSEAIAKALAYTELPEKTFDWDPDDVMPFDSFFISLPEDLIYVNGKQMEGEDRLYPLEGIYISKDYVKLSAKGKELPAVVVLGVSKDLSEGALEAKALEESLERIKRGERPQTTQSRDDIMFYRHWHKGSDILSENYQFVDGSAVIFKIAYNFLYFNRNFQEDIHFQKVEPFVRGFNWKSKRSRKREEVRDNKKGVTRNGYTYLDLISKNPVKKCNKPNSHTGKKLQKEVVVPGHVHGFWSGPLKEDGVKIPYEEWEKKRTFKKIWIKPYKKGPQGTETTNIKNIKVRW